MPGAWRAENAPYARGMMDVPFKDGVVECAFPKAAQVGASEIMRNLIAYMAHYEPSPAGLVLPDRDKGEQIVKDRIFPLFDYTPCLAELKTSRAHDIKRSQITLRNGFVLYLMWSGSPSSLASNPIRFAVADETDKFALSAGREADPVSLLRKRLRTYGERARLLKLSTPTTRLGQIWQEHEDADIKLYFLVECPHCGKWQRLVFPQVKWFKPKGMKSHKKLATYIINHGAAWYECGACGGEISESKKRQIVQRGRWGTIDERGMADGVVEDAEAVESFKPGTRISMHISALYPRWVSLSDVAAEFLRAQGKLGALFDFICQTLGEPFEQQISKLAVNQFAERSKAARLAETIVPAWAACLIASIDTQMEYFYVVIRAWGPQMRSQRVWHGRPQSFQELDEICSTAFKVEGNAYRPMTVQANGIALIDSGGTTQRGESLSRTQQVYLWGMERAAWVRVIKGSNRDLGGQVFKWGRGYYDPTGGADKISVPLCLLDVNRLQDFLVELVGRKLVIGGDEVWAWDLNGNNDGVYNAHMSNMQKVADRNNKGELEERWVPISDGARIDYRDCEVYQIGGAYLARVHLLPGHDEFMDMKAKAIAPQGEQRPAVTMPDGRPFFVLER